MRSSAVHSAGPGQGAAGDWFPTLRPHVELIARRRAGALRLARRDATAQRVGELMRPGGFRIGMFASHLDSPRMLAVGVDGTVYATLPRTGQVVALQDTDEDGRADRRRVMVSDLPEVHGICIHDGQMYLATVDEVFVCRIRDDATVGSPELLLENLPFGGRHPCRTIGFGPDEHLYIAVGSSGHCCKESNPEHATILRASPNGMRRSVFARGLRNASGFGWHPLTDQMWAMDDGNDGFGGVGPPEELNRVEEGKDYGWPFVWGDGQLVSTDAVNIESLQALAQTTVPPVLTYEAHSSPMAMVFYTGDQFPPRYRNDAFVTMHGSSGCDPAVGHEVVRIRFDRRGQPVAFQKFVSGFLIDGGRGFFGRPAGLAVAKDGSLLVGDDANGVIYRVSYEGEGR